LVTPKLEEDIVFALALEDVIISIKVLIGPTDQNVYVGIGDVGGHRTRTENTANGPPPDGTGGILRVTQDGQAVPNSPLGNGDNTSSNLNFYYAYGIRNTFGMDFDPVTGTLWDTADGHKFKVWQKTNLQEKQ